MVQWVHLTWWSSSVVHTLQGPYLSGPDTVEFPKWTFKLDLTFETLATNNILCSDSYILFPRCSFVSKHVPAFSQSLKCAIDYLIPVLAECLNSSWFKMWVSPWLQTHPGLWSFETDPKPIYSPIKVDNETKADRGIIVLEKSMHCHDDKPTVAFTAGAHIPDKACELRWMRSLVNEGMAQLDSSNGCEVWQTWS